MTACLHWPTMRKHPAATTQAVRPLSGKPLRPWSGAVGSSWLLLGVLLTGLFAMHGLGAHGSHAAREKTMSVVMSSPMAMLEAATTAAVKDADPHGSTPAAAEDGTRTVAALSTSTPTWRSAADGRAMADTSSTAPQRPTDLPNADRVDRHVDGGVPGKSPGPGGLLGLCLAVLTAFIAWALAGGQALRVVARVPHARAAAVPRRRGRDRDPPSRLMLSVHRC